MLDLLLFHSAQHFSKTLLVAQDYFNIITATGTLVKKAPKTITCSANTSAAVNQQGRLPLRSILAWLSTKHSGQLGIIMINDHDHGFSIFMSWRTNLSWILIMRMVDDATHLDKLDKVSRLNRDTAISPRCELEIIILIATTTAPRGG